MKIAVSIPDEIFNNAEALVKKFNTSRSEVYARALNEFIGNHSPERLTEAMNNVVDAVTLDNQSFNSQAARQAFAQTEW